MLGVAFLQLWGLKELGPCTFSASHHPTLLPLPQAALLEERDLGVLLSLVTLLLGVVSRSYEGFESLVPRVVKILHRLNPERERDAAGHTVVDRVSVPPEYQYYGIPSPWLQVCCMPHV